MNTDLERLLELVSLTRNEGLTNKEYDEMFELKSKLNEKLEKAEKHDELINGRYGILELNKIISDKRDEVQPLKSENKELLEQNVKLILGYKDLKSQQEKTEIDKIFFALELSKRNDEVEKLNKAIDGIRELTKNPRYADYGSQSFYYIETDELKSILKEVNNG